MSNRFVELAKAGTDQQVKRSHVEFRFLASLFSKRHNSRPISKYFPRVREPIKDTDKNMALKYKLGTAFLELKGHFFNIPNHRIPLHSAENLKINIII